MTMVEVSSPRVRSRRTERVWIAIVAAAIAGLALWSVVSGGVMWTLYSAALRGEFVSALRAYMLDLGPVGAIAYVTAVALEVLITPIPAALIYAPGGAIFGGLWGGTLSLVGNVLGALVACFIGRAYGEEWLERRSPDGNIKRLKRLLQEHDIWVLFLLRLNPLTTADFISYVAGVAGLSPVRVAIATGLGLAPLCYLQAYLAEAFLEAIPTWAILTFGLVLIGTVVAVLRKG